MRAPLALVVVLLASLLTGSVAAQDALYARLVTAQANAALAATRAARLERAAARAGDSASRGTLAAAALAARGRSAEADIAVAEARLVVARRAVLAQQAALATRQGPIARLLAALQSLAIQPPLVALTQPGSIDDLVHVRAVLGTTIPAIRARTLALRTGLERDRALQRSAAVAAATLRDGRARLESNRLAAVRLDAERRLRPSTGIVPAAAIRESASALALGEQARDILGALDLTRNAAEVEASLATLDGPLPRPGAADPPAAPTPAYRLPARGRIVTGFGELSDTGVRSRGLTLAVRPGAAVVAPAAGRIVYAGPFRQYGLVVVIDHGAGWSSALTGLAETGVRAGQRLAAGAALGRAAGGEDPRVTVELRRRGRPVEPAPLIG